MNNIIPFVVYTVKLFLFSLSYVTQKCFTQAKLRILAGLSLSSYTSLEPGTNLHSKVNLDLPLTPVVYIGIFTVWTLLNRKGLLKMSVVDSLSNNSQDLGISITTVDVIKLR